MSCNGEARKGQRQEGERVSAASRGAPFSGVCTRSWRSGALVPAVPCGYTHAEA